MIGFDELGVKGWLGNQMFQYASLKGIASFCGYEYCIPPNDATRSCNYLLFDLFKLSTLKNISYINKPTYIHKTSDIPGHSTSFHFENSFMEECPDNVNISGFFQSEKYFKHISDSIRKDFEFKDYILEECLSFISQFDKKPIFLHIRRGDYLKKSNHHNVLSIEYYERALQYFDDNTNVIVFSDDIEWCKKQKLFSSDRFFLSETTDRLPLTNYIRQNGYTQGALVPHFDLCLMSLCSGAIIANSSFSWWGAWIQDDQNKKVIAPNKWYGPLNSHLIIKDLCPDDWIII